MVYFTNVWQHKHAALRSAHENCVEFRTFLNLARAMRSKGQPASPRLANFGRPKFEGGKTKTPSVQNRKTFSGAIAATLLFRSEKREIGEEGVRACNYWRSPCQ